MHAVADLSGSWTFWLIYVILGSLISTTFILSKVSHSSRLAFLRRIDNWRFWNGVAFFGLGILAIGLYVQFGRQSREAAARTAQTRAGLVQGVATCFTSVLNAPLIDGFIDGQRALITNGILGNQSLLRIETDPALTAVRLESLARLRKAQRNVNKLDALVRKTTPTEKKCVQLAKDSGVPYAKYLDQLEKSKQAQKAPKKGEK